ncbi:major facilitator superfamily domain-containing protein [Fennellomyces sp. T-0311]|nr:major facilitator superfamily domain-containing protein [Fennellomyces sp. T-0311]
MNILPKARLGGIMESLQLTESQYQWCLSSPFLAYFFLSIPINIILRLWRPSLLLALWALMIGGLAMCTVSVKNFAGLIVLQTISGFIHSAGFSGLLAFGIKQIPTTQLDSWQWMYIIYGLPGIIVAVAAYLVLPDQPETAKFLTETERKFAIDRLATEQAYTSTDKWEWKHVVTVLTDVKVYWFSLVIMLGAIIGSGTRLALPAIIDGMGDWSEDVSLALTTPPMISAAICTYFYARLSDHWYSQRAYFLIGAYALAMVGFFIIMFVPEENVGVRYFAVCILTIGTNIDSPVKYAWYSCNFSGPTRRAIATAVVFSFEAAGNAIGGQAYFDPPRYLMGHTIALSAFGADVILILGLRVMLNRTNKRRAAMTLDEKEREIAKFGGDNIVGDRHPNFRYAL